MSLERSRPGAAATESGRSVLRRLLREPAIVVAPGVADGLGARLVQQAGFPAVYASGGAINRSRGVPDVGATSITELCDRVNEITEACDLPLIVDADSGFGGIVNLRRTVRLLEKAGVAALHIQDSEVPRRTAEPGKNCLAARDMALRVAAACDVRQDPELVVIARTDVMDDLGLDEAIARAKLYARAGADVVYVEHLRTRDDMARAAEAIRHPLLVSLNKGLGELPAPAELAAMGYRILTHPADLQLSAIHAMRAVLRHLSAAGTTQDYPDMIGFAERDEIVGLAGVQASERSYLHALSQVSR
jgi:2-methylisocitrate lyase-like PEP mutase family enzyme